MTNLGRSRDYLVVCNHGTIGSAHPLVHEAYSQACLTEEIETNRISVFSLMIYILETNNQR